jgi:WD40 repeat protein
MKNGKQIRRFNAHGDAVLSVDFAPDGRICTSSADHTVKLWQADGKGIRTFAPLDDWVYEACFADQGKVVLAGTWTGRISMFDTGADAAVWTFDSNPKPDPSVAAGSASAGSPAAR